MKPYPTALLEKIAAKVDASGGPEACHPWNGATHRKRGTLSDTPVVSIRKDNYNPRRVLREIALATRLETAQRVRDTCGSTLCCNPKHLKGGTLADRLEAQLDKNGPIVRPELGPCWVWIGYTDQKGYGRLRTKRGTPWILAHRLAYNLAYGVELPSEVLALHHCDNPPCCNPDHFFLGTAADNHRDMERKGRMPSGPKHRMATAGALAKAHAALRAKRADQHKGDARPEGTEKKT